MGRGTAVEELQKICPSLLLMGYDIFTPPFSVLLFSFLFALQDCLSSFIVLQCMFVSQPDAVGNC